nr:DNA polymerase III subunit chi [uncultured Aquabacterium sp.]
MPRVEFHHGIGNKVSYACRLLRKAHRAGARVVVTADAAALQELNRELWTFDEQEFLPHVLADGEALPERLHATPIWLSTDPASAPGERTILVNLGRSMPAGLERFERLFDLVSSEPDDRQEGRQRWKAYAALGWDVQPHEVKDEARG